MARVPCRAACISSWLCCWAELGSSKGIFAQCASVNLSGIALVCLPGTWVCKDDLETNIAIISVMVLVKKRWSLRAYTYSSSCFLRTLNVDGICGFLACEYNNVPSPLPFLTVQTSDSSRSFQLTLLYSNVVLSGTLQGDNNHNGTSWELFP
jgi:hypothetical protein